MPLSLQYSWARGLRKISRFSERILPDFDILPEHRLSDPQSQGLYESLFCGKPHCQASGAVLFFRNRIAFRIL